MDCILLVLFAAAPSSKSKVPSTMAARPGVSPLVTSGPRQPALTTGTPTTSRPVKLTQTWKPPGTLFFCYGQY